MVDPAESIERAVTGPEAGPDKARMAMAVLARQIRQARADPNAFIEFAGKIEGGGRPVQAELHREWQKMFTENENVVLWAPVYTGKSQQLSRWRTEWEIGRNPSLRVAIISETEKQPKKILGAIQSDILENERLKMVFPKLRPSRGKRRVWREDAILVDRTDVMLDPTIQVLGAYGAILGSRLDLIILDDILDLLNTLTEHQREKMFDWISQEVLSRATHGARLWIIGTAWHDMDIMHRFAKETEVFASKKYAITYFDNEGVEHSTCPELWSLDQIYKRAKVMGTIASRRMMWNELRLPDGSRIKEEWIEQCLKRGRGLPMAKHWNQTQAYTGVDLASTKGAKSHETVLFTAARLPEGTRRVLDVRAGKWTGPEILRQLEDVYRRYDSRIYVETNGAQNFLMQFASHLTTLPISGHTTGMNKHDEAWGVDSIGVELEKEMWIIPCDEDLMPHPQMQRAIEEAVNYSPEIHAGDRLMAWWICREGLRQGSAAGMDTFNVDLLRR